MTHKRASVAAVLGVALMCLSRPPAAPAMVLPPTPSQEPTPSAEPTSSEEPTSPVEPTRTATRIVISARSTAVAAGATTLLRASLLTSAGPLRESNAAAVVWAKRQLGKRYRYGTAGPKTFDCSGLTFFCYAKIGIRLSRTAAGQSGDGVYVSRLSLAPGDLVFFGRPVHHAGMYIGAGRYIHAPRTGDRVKISKLSWRKDYAVGRRPHRRYLKVWRRRVEDTTWRGDGLAIWSQGAYLASRRVASDTLFSARFSGDATYAPAASDAVTITVDR